MAPSSSDGEAPVPEDGPLPWSEDERLEALESYAILDTPPEPVFDDLAQLAADVCGTPVALLSLVAGDRQWFKAEVGLGLREAPLDLSACSSLLLLPGLTVIPDMTADARFACNPLVSDEPGLRFYAGVLLVGREGLPLGTLCVFDVKPRPEGLTAWQARALSTLAAQAMDSLELRRLLSEREAAEQREREATWHRARVVLDSISDGVVALDADWRLAFLNNAVEAFLGKSRHEMLGRKLIEVFPMARSTTLARFREVMETGRPASFETRLAVRPDRIVQVRVAPMDKGLTLSFTDITEWKHAEETQQVLIAELQHRTRNLLAVVRSVAMQTAETSASLADFSRAFGGRLSALGRAQSLLSQGGGAGVSVREIVESALTAHGAEADGDRIRIDGPDVHLSSKAVQAVALALHELATNALKYGALGQPQARLSVRWELLGGEAAPFVSIRWAEEGVTLPHPPGYEARGFGRQLIERALPYDLGAATRFRIEADGVRCEIDVPLRR